MQRKKISLLKNQDISNFLINARLNRLKNLIYKTKNLQTKFDFSRLSVASPDRILSWSTRVFPTGAEIGEVIEREFLDPESGLPTFSGLFCPRIFGPVFDNMCICGIYNIPMLNIDKDLEDLKYTKSEYTIFCLQCGIELNESRTRKYRMGYIALEVPVIHPWFFKGNSSFLFNILELCFTNFTRNLLESIVYCREIFSIEYIEKEANTVLNLTNFKLNLEKAFRQAKTRFRNQSDNVNFNDYLVNSEILEILLDSIDYKAAVEILRGQLQAILLESKKESNMVDSSQKLRQLVKRIRILDSILINNIQIKWIISRVIPVVPPILRPLDASFSDQLKTSELNRKYQTLLELKEQFIDSHLLFSINETPRKFFQIETQQTFETIVDGTPKTFWKFKSVNNRTNAGILGKLASKEGRFRNNLLGKRVDFSARSTIVVNPTLQLNQCGLPEKLAATLFSPFYSKEGTGFKTLRKPLKLLIEKNSKIFNKFLNSFCVKYPIILNRAPTLHKFGIQAFIPVIVQNFAIQLHPNLCLGFNADFDGDQMAIHLPFFASSQLEAKMLMLPSYNILSPATEKLIVKPTQDIVIGSSYLTIFPAISDLCSFRLYFSRESAIQDFAAKKINLHERVFVKLNAKDLYLEEIGEGFNDEKNEYILKSSTNMVFQIKTQLLKKYQVSEGPVFCYTSIGICIADWTKTRFIIHDFFLETTPGRLLFEKVFCNEFLN